MKYGILGDIHGNLEALTAVLEEMDRQGVEKYVSVGDLVGYGANPIEVIDTVRKLSTLVVAGNHDFAAVDKLNIDFFNTYARESAIWTRNILPEAYKQFIKSLKLVEYCDNFTVVHSTLYSPELFEYIQTSYDAHLSFEQQTTSTWRRRSRWTRG
jgi:predicted phosphodiesterase